MKIVPFSTPIWAFQLDPQFEKEIEKCLELEKNSDGNTVSNQGGFQSKNLDFRQEFPALFEAMEPFVLSVAQEVGIDLSITSSWVNVNRRGHYNLPHVHPKNALSVVVYLQTTPETGSIVFKNPTPSTHYISDRTKLFPGMYYIDPKPGTLLVFPSFLEHMVKPNDTDDVRISIAINLAEVINDSV
jgi:uncharacterized protein (TIGR02466 family)